MLASVLQEARYNVGIYSSPHLKDFRERIKLNGNLCSKEFVISFIAKHKSYFIKEKLSFFEMTVGMAFCFFSEKKVDYAIIEVGLGGRLDATNIIQPILSIITNIGLDHMNFLGNTHQKISIEKAGIIKKNTPIIIGEYHPETLPVFRTKASELNAQLIKAFEENQTLPETDLKGFYQKNNINTTLTAINELIKQGLEIKPSHIVNGFKKVAKNTKLQGRWQILKQSPKIICDTGHNKEGLKYVIEQLKQEKYQQLHIVIGVVNDKDLNSILPLFPSSANYYFCRPNINRGLDAKKLQNKAAEYGLHGKTYHSVASALAAAKQTSSDDDLIFIGGSTFVIAEIL